ncbi:transposase [Clostridium lacusfryxellense]|uniref:transposase n=1 Tax=Clostridium lacusfryxellense TaxID=205328 RepID=UPI001FE74457|nr:transposase [Clostridium lacusfryxellense]
MSMRLTVKDKNKLLLDEGKQLLNYGLVLRIYPSEEQETLINKTFGCSRFIYNKYLSDRKDCFSNTKTTLRVNNYKAEVMNPLKQKKGLEFLKEVDKFALEAALENVEDAYSRFFKHQTNFPRFKSKKHAKKSYTTKYTNDNIRVDLDKVVIRLPKLKEVLFALPKQNKTNNKILNIGKETTKITKAIISQKGTRYYVSLTIEEVIPLIKKLELNNIDNSKIIGLDMGLKDFLIASNGRDNFKTSNPKFLRNSEKKLIKLQKKLPKKIEGSKNYLKAKERLNLIHAQVANQRKDFMHKLSRKLINENQVIVVEDLNIKGMIKNHKLAKSISDAGWYKFVTFLKYKLEWQGKQLVKIDRFFASSKLCNHCGTKNIMLTLSDREWTCSKCNQKHDRDINASLNIRSEGMRILGLV